jgi:hypothetical protein
VDTHADSGKCDCKGPTPDDPYAGSICDKHRHDSEKAVEDQFMKAAEECGKFIRAKFEELARKA